MSVAYLSKKRKTKIWPSTYTHQVSINTKQPKLKDHEKYGKFCLSVLYIRYLEFFQVKAVWVLRYGWKSPEAES